MAALAAAEKRLVLVDRRATLAPAFLDRRDHKIDANVALLKLSHHRIEIADLQRQRNEIVVHRRGRDTVPIAPCP